MHLERGPTGAAEIELEALLEPAAVAVAVAGVSVAIPHNHACLRSSARMLISGSGNSIWSRGPYVFCVRTLEAREGKGEGEKYVWCKRTGFCALTPECWRHQSDCS